MVRIAGIITQQQIDFRGSLVAGNARYRVVFDGTIYNAPELGKAENDAALVLQLVDKHGVVSALEKLNADFALAIYDSLEDVLWLARDRFGVQPLYYLRSFRMRAFASQPKGIAAISGERLMVDEHFVARFAGNHYRGIEIDPNASPYRNVAQVPPATVVKLSASAERQYTYWSLNEQPDWTASPEELAAEYQALLLDAVAIRQRGAQRSAFTLSGGLDSSTVVASVAHLTGRPQPAFSAVYEDQTYDESGDIPPMLGSRVAPWQRVPVENPDVFSLVAEMVELHDEPVVTATWLSHYLVVQAVAAAGYTTLWGGLGGDELNAGEYEYFMYYFADLKRAGREAELQEEIKAWVGHHDHPIWRKSAALVEQELARVVDLARPGYCRPDTARLSRYHEALLPDWVLRAQDVALPDQPFTSYLKNRTYQDLTRETLPCCLRAEDRHAAAAGLQRRLPFLDYRLAEFMWRVPGDLKIRQGVTKYLLRQATKGILPEETRVRVKKTGWNAPAHQWFFGRGREQLLDMVHSRAFRQRGIYNVPAVERLIAEHEDIVATGRPEANHMMFLWQMVNLELWLASVEQHQYTTPYVQEKTNTA